MKVAMPNLLLLNIAKRALQKITGVTLGQKVAIKPNLVQSKLRVAADCPTNLHESTYHNLVAGKKLEIEGIFCYVTKASHSTGIPTPTLVLIYAFLRPRVAGGTPE